MGDRDLLFSTAEKAHSMASLSYRIESFIGILFEETLFYGALSPSGEIGRHAVFRAQ